MATILISSFQAASEEETRDNLVELHIAIPRSEAYRENRSSWSTRIGISYESFLPNQFVSPVDQSTYATDFGSNGIIPIVGANFGVQHSSALGTFYLDGLYGKGNATALSGVQSTLSLTKYGVGVGYMLDSFASNPWVIPYGSAQEVFLGWSNSVGTSSQSGTTAYTTVFQAGIAVPLSQVDTEAGYISHRDFGIKETYLDVYGVEYLTSNNATDPEFVSGFQVGAGFHVIF